jgi:hypothetical protein
MATKRPNTSRGDQFVRRQVKEVSLSLEPMEQRRPDHIAIPPSRLPPLSVVEEIERLRVSSARRQTYYQQHLAPIPGWKERVAKSADRMRQLRAAPPPRRNYHLEKNDPVALKARFAVTGGPKRTPRDSQSAGRQNRQQVADGQDGAELVYDVCAKRCDEMINLLREAQRIMNFRDGPVPPIQTES